MRAALVAMFRDRTGADDTAAEAWLAGLRADGRYLEDIWGESGAA